MSELKPDPRPRPATPAPGVRPFTAPRHRTGTPAGPAAAPTSVARPGGVRTTPPLGVPPMVSRPVPGAAERAAESPVRVVGGEPAAPPEPAAVHTPPAAAVDAPTSSASPLAEPGAETAGTAWMEAIPSVEEFGVEELAPGEPEGTHFVTPEPSSSATDPYPTDEFGFPDVPPGTVIDAAEPDGTELDEYVAATEPDWSWIGLASATPAPEPELPVAEAEEEGLQGAVTPVEALAPAVASAADEAVEALAGEAPPAAEADSLDSFLVQPEEEGSAVAEPATEMGEPGARAGDPTWPEDAWDELPPQGDPLLTELAPGGPEPAPAAPHAGEVDVSALGYDEAAATPTASTESSVDVAEQGAGSPRDEVAQVLATLAERIRRGELEVPNVRPDQGEAAALAATLAALLNSGR